MLGLCCVSWKERACFESMYDATESVTQRCVLTMFNRHLKLRSGAEFQYEFLRKLCMNKIALLKIFSQFSKIKFQQSLMTGSMCKLSGKNSSRVSRFRLFLRRESMMPTLSVLLGIYWVNCELSGKYKQII